MVSMSLPVVRVIAGSRIQGDRLREQLRRDGFEEDAGAEIVVVLLDQDGTDEVDLPSFGENARVVVVGRVARKRLWVLVDDGVHAVVEPDDPGALGAAIRSAAAGNLTLPYAAYAERRRPVLSRREKQILGLVVMGLSNGEIARKLVVSETTVKSHLRSCFAKLGVKSRNEATALILDPEQRLGTGILAITDDAASR
jgi:DNA-binding CsgD family transcriptional regulator